MQESEKRKYMSQLIILGNTNKYTFCNAVLGAQAKSHELWNDNIEDIYVLHSRESFEKLLKNDMDWLKHLNGCDIDESIFIHRIIDFENNISSMVNYIKNILKNCNLKNLIIDVSNGTTELKTTLSTIAYILDINQVYFINSTLLLSEHNKEEFLDCTEMKKYYKEMISNKDIDELAYLNHTEVIRYAGKIEKLSDIIYETVNKEKGNVTFFKNNLLHALEIKIKSDKSNVNDNTLYRISSSAIFTSLEDLIDRLLIKYKTNELCRKTLGQKIHILQDIIEEKASSVFDFRFLQEFNSFILYLRNTSTHKTLDLSDSEKFKAELSVSMSLIFLEYYSTIVINELENVSISKIDKEYVIKESSLEKSKERYFGLDGDNTGQLLEALLESCRKEQELSDFSKKIRNAKDHVCSYIRKSEDSKIIFSEGDDILFKGKFDLDDLKKMKRIYTEKSGGLTCSIGYGNSFREVLFSMKLAKMEKDSIRGIEFCE